MFECYEKESGQTVEPGVIKQLFYETNGQPGLTCWFGELLTQGFEHYENQRDKPLTLNDFQIVLAAAAEVLPNNNILNIISKAQEKSKRLMILEMFQTREKLPFKFDNKTINNLYMNGIVEKDVRDRTEYFVKFSCPFVQKRLFNFFSDELFHKMGTLTDPFVKLDNVITDTEINIPNLLALYQAYIDKNKEWLFKSAPRRVDMRIYEAVYHFNLYAYLSSFLNDHGGRVYPEFPTGNGKIDLIITYSQHRTGLELKSFTNERSFRDALQKAAQYGDQLGLKEIYLVCFIEYIEKETRKTFEIHYLDNATGVNVVPVFIVTGN